MWENKLFASVALYKVWCGCDCLQLKPGSKAYCEVPWQSQAKTLQHTGMPGQTGVIRGHLYQDMSSKLSTQPFCACWFSPSAVSHTFACQRHIGLALLRGLRGLPLLVLKRICERTSCLHQWRYTRFGVDATVCNWNQVQRPTVKSLDKAKQRLCNILACHDRPG